MDHRVVITGYDVVLPKIENKSDFTKYLRNGIPTYGFSQSMQDAGLMCNVGGHTLINDKEIENLTGTENYSNVSRSTKIAILCGLKAWLDSGLSINVKEEIVDYTCGIYMGTGVGSLQLIIEDLIPKVKTGNIQEVQRSTLSDVMKSNLTESLSHILNIGGPSLTYSSACCSGSDAIIDAYHSIKNGRMIRVLAGGVEEDATAVWSLFDSLFVLNRRSNNNPLQASRPLSASAAGFIPTGGAGVLILENIESALERGAYIYAEILSGTNNCGAQKNRGSMTYPNNEAAQRCVIQAIEQSGIEPKDIQLINGHFTGTKADPVEYKNWNTAFQYFGIKLPIVQASKSLFGHGLGAAGPIEICAILDQFDKGYIHRNINCEDIHPEIAELAKGKNLINGTVEKNELNCAIKASFGFGDVNSCMILKKYYE